MSLPVVACEKQKKRRKTTKQVHAYSGCVVVCALVSLCAHLLACTAAGVQGLRPKRVTVKLYNSNGAQRLDVLNGQERAPRPYARPPLRLAVGLQQLLLVRRLPKGSGRRKVLNQRQSHRQVHLRLQALRQRIHVADGALRELHGTEPVGVCTRACMRGCACPCVRMRPCVRSPQRASWRRICGCVCTFARGLACMCTHVLVRMCVSATAATRKFCVTGKAWRLW